MTAQERYVPGYFIDTSGARHDVLIRSASTRFAPERVVFRRGAKAATEELPREAIQAYGLDDLSERYVRFTVRMDQSRQELSELTSSPTPEWKERTVLLKQLLEGTADLYSYTEGTQTTYFLRTGTATPRQLIARRYRGEARKVHQDVRYLAQLAQQLICRSGQLPDGVHTVKYTERELQKIVTAYNRCAGGEPTLVYRPAPAPVRFWLRGGVERGDGTYQVTSSRTRNVALGSTTVPRLGVEAEYPLPFTRRRFQLYLGADYRAKTTSYGMVENTYVAAREVRLDYVALSFPLGLRRYLSLGKSSLLLTAGGLLDVPLGNGLIYTDTHGNRVETSTSFGLQLGGGLQWERLRLEARYHHKRNIAPGYSHVFVHYRAVALSVGYRLR